MPFELEFLNDLRRDLLTAAESRSRLAAAQRAGRRPRRRLAVLGGVIAAALLLVLVGLGEHPWRSGGSTGVPTASAAIEQRLRGLRVVHTATGGALDTADATILGSATTSQGTLYLVTGFHLVSGITDPCEGVLAPEALDSTYSQLPGSNLYFGQYTCKSAVGWGSSIMRLGGVAVGIFGTASPSTVRVSLVGPSGTADLPLHDGVYGTVVPYASPAPTGLITYDATGTVIKSVSFEPQYFVKDYTYPDETSPHHTLIAETLPDGRPITIELTDTDRYGAYAWFLTIAGTPVKAQSWEDDGPAGDPGTLKPDFWTDEILSEGGARVVLVSAQAHATATASLDDGTTVPLTFEPVSAHRSVAMAIIPAAEATHQLTVTGTAPDGSPLGSDTADLGTATVTKYHETN
jgi:hypothetical protein